ncbi:hypothetical protein [uncultured Tissierella sp.]|uniref:hypothetical protein n=1 Tax=uncultured Tissierella sp. TaxID=448160 RepID=UPI002805A776|nr:hypothetical protein [uncultured Tissierella sp.]MDU5080280.1 hypothetical protein [Bacillota bacterium]
MNDSKMYRMLIDMEHKSKKKSFQRRLSMSQMYRKKKKKIQRTIAKSMITIIEIVLAMFIAFIVSLWAIPTAYNHRGYTAIGGEWILIILVFGFSFVLISDCVENRIERERRKIARCHYVQSVKKESGL